MRKRDGGILLSPLAAASILVLVAGFSAAGGMSYSWKRPDVVPVVLVKPGIGGFEPLLGGAIGNTWRKSDVRPVVLVKPGIGGLEPVQGTSIGNVWKKGDVVAVMLVEPSPQDFVPLRVLSTNEASPAGPAQGRQPGQAGDGKGPAMPPAVQVTPLVVESQIDGEFEGWEGETVVRLTNGQVWLQTEYYYHYHYAFMPRVLIYKSTAGYKMKVDGVERAVGVTRLK